MIEPVSAFGTAMATGAVINTINVVAGKVFSATKAVGDANAYIQPRSLIDATSAARVEPLTIVGADCVNLEYLPDVLQSLQSMFTGYWLQAIALNNEIGKIQVMRTLDRYNPNRKFSLSRESISESTQSTEWRMAQESYKWRLPTTKNKVAMEDEKKRVGVTFGRDDVANVSDLANLSVGKLVNVTLRNGGETIEVPISIRLMVNQIPERSLQLLFTRGADDNTFTERYHAWRAGRIGFIKDLILCQDLIDANKRALMKDKDGIYSEIVRRANQSTMAGIRTGNPSLASASNLIVVSESTINAVQQKIGGKMDNPKVREKIFAEGYAMIIAVIDRQNERVKFYHRGIASSTEVGLKDIRSANKGGGPDIGDILKAYTLGASPSL